MQLARLQHTQALVPSHSTIADPAEHAYFVQKYQQIWKLPPSVAHFAGPSPVSLERAHLPRLADEACVCALKTDGVRYLLLLTTAPDGACVALMIDRAMKMYEIEVCAHAKYFQDGTLLDGELVWSYANYATSLTYIVYDVVQCAGRSYIREPYTLRMQALFGRVLSHAEADTEDAILDKNAIVARNNAHDLTLAVKPIVPLAQLARLWDARNHAHHTNDGLIFTLDAHPVDINTSQSIFKWKSSHTIDVLLRAHDGEWRACAQDGSHAVELRAVGRHAVHVVHNDVAAEGAIVECACTLEDATLTLFPLKQRIDKAAANTVRTIERTLVSIAEQLTIDELLEFAAASE